MPTSDISRPLLDTTKICTIEDLNNTDFAKYVNKDGDCWVRYTENRTLTSELKRLCALSVGSKVILTHAFGWLYYRKRKHIVPKHKLIKLTMEDIAHISKYIEYGTVNVDDILMKIIKQAKGT